MKITIVKEDKLVIVDGNAVSDESFDFSNLPSSWHALQWEGDVTGLKGKGEIEYNETPEKQRYNQPITDIIEYMPFVIQAKELYEKYLESRNVT